MSSKLRLVKYSQEEARIYDNKKKEASERFDYLIVQALCFNYYKEYFELTKLYVDYIKTSNLDVFLQSINQYKYLFDLGFPSKKDIDRVTTAYRFVVEDSNHIPTDPQAMEIKRLITRLMIRAIILNKQSAFTELAKISENFRSSQNPDLKAIKITLHPYFELLLLKDSL